MINKYLDRKTFNGITKQISKSLNDIAQSDKLTDDQVYEMTIILIKSYINVIIPIKEGK